MTTIKDKTFILECREGYTPEIGRLLAMMEYARRTTIEATQHLTVEELDYRINGQGNSIGSLLLHIACVEEVYQILTFEERDPTEQEMEKLRAGLTLGDCAFEASKGNDASFYIEKLSKVREITISELKQKEDKWLDEEFPFGPNHLANNYFRWFHVFEDELNHRGQIRLIVGHKQRNTD
ncbi:DinB family protein [Sutcliffiella horikoshii]|uniref:DinB family protein n=1 Tax=Sutcliffiella horikoshii TaxID=79883 RepID=UPI00384E3729